MQEPVTVGIMLRAHARANTLEIVLDEFARLNAEARGLVFHVSVWVDRPTPAVSALLDSRRRQLLHVLLSPYSLVSHHGERFMDAANDQLTALLKAQPACDWIGYWDDDAWLEPKGARAELPLALRDDSVDILYARAVFFQDAPNTINPLRQHCSPLFFRPLEGDRFPTNRIINATEARHDDAIAQGRIRTLETPLLDYGTYSKEERKRVFDAYLQAGKVDAFTVAGSDRCSPVLKPYALEPEWDYFKASLSK